MPSRAGEAAFPSWRCLPEAPTSGLNPRTSRQRQAFLLCCTDPGLRKCLNLQRPLSYLPSMSTAQDSLLHSGCRGLHYCLP
mmetsp:Transcript_58731/g.171877  ORF Transcript_58731/g.171877 Transcript_58731/m.171877 type:complete len:81 (-) Transcript_58731:164-406(-)